MTPVSVLRHVIGLTAHEFGDLISKSHSTVVNLETDRLKLSQATAHKIATETGVSMAWLLANDPKVKPYTADGGQLRQCFGDFPNVCLSAIGKEL
jgi:transcriptional regulator with XRE-family HTH domain